MSRFRRFLPQLTIPERRREALSRAFLAFFSWIWVLQILIPLWETWRNEPSRGIRIGVTSLVVCFIVAYSWVIFRLFFYRRSWTLIYTARERWLLRAIVSGVAVTLVFWQGNAWALALLFAVITIVLTAPPLQAFFAMIASLVGVVVVLFLAPVEFGMMVSVLSFSLVFGMLIASQMRQGGEIGELMTARYAEVRMAATEERLRIARDLHDVLGHTLSLITLKSELASRLADVDLDRAQQEMRDVERIARSAMSEVRRTVAGERHPVLAAELDAARQLLLAADINVQVEGGEQVLPDEIASIFAWGVREGVTNVVRHSRARRCRVLLERSRDEVWLRITDDGAGTDAPVPGTGLAGLRQRVEEMGGTLSFAPTPDRPGHRLCLRVPIPAGEEGE